jgi:heme/copper-type cytochrome/quinol oxidase subunit 3
MKSVLLTGGAIASLALSSAMTLFILQLVWAVAIFGVLSAAYFALRSQAQGLNPEQLKYTIRLYLYRLLSKRKTKC